MQKSSLQNLDPRDRGGVILTQRWWKGAPFIPYTMVNMILGAWWWECKYQSVEVEGASDRRREKLQKSGARQGLRSMNMSCAWDICWRVATISLTSQLYQRTKHVLTTQYQAPRRHQGHSKDEDSLFPCKKLYTRCSGSPGKLHKRQQPSGPSLWVQMVIGVWMWAESLWTFSSDDFNFLSRVGGKVIS